MIMKKLAAAAALLFALAQFAPAQDASAGPAGKMLGEDSVIQRTSSYTVHELCFERGGHTLYGNLYLPSGGSAPYPVAIIAHGYRSRYAYTAPYAQDLAARGIAAYVFDFYGGSQQTRSGGSMTEMSVLTEKADMEAVLDGILGYSFADKERIILMGESQGGMVAALLGADRRADVRALVLLYPALVIPDYARSQFKTKSEIPEVTQALGTTVGRIYYEDVFDMDVYDEIKDFDGPVLIVHGDADTLVPISYAERASQTYADCTLKVISGAGHGFLGESLRAACEAVADFVKSRV